MAELWAPLLSLCSNPAGPSVSAGGQKVLYQNSQRCVWVTAGDIPPCYLPGQELRRALNFSHYRPFNFCFLFSPGSLGPYVMLLCLCLISWPHRLSPVHGPREGRAEGAWHQQPSTAVSPRAGAPYSIQTPWERRWQWGERGRGEESVGNAGGDLQGLWGCVSPV